MDNEKWKEMFESMCKQEGTEFIKFLLDSGIEINVLTKQGTTLLSCAAECGNLEIVQYLLDKGADYNVPNYDGSNALHMADRNGHEHVVRLFIDKGMSR